jgi:hypothetical protein
MERMPDGGEVSTENGGSKSRREFASRIGGGTAAAFGMAWAAPKISTIRLTARAAQVGSPHGPPTSTTTTNPGNPPPRGRLRLSASAACVGESCDLHGEGFAPNTAVTLQVDSGTNSLGILTADGNGDVNSTIMLTSDLPRGHHRIRAAGIAPGGRTLVVSAPLNIKDQGDCDTNEQGSTTTAASRTSVSGTTATTPTSTPTPSTLVSRASTQGGGPGPPPSQGSGLLAFTGTDAADLAVLGIAAAIGGRALYALARNADDGDEEE